MMKAFFFFNVDIFYFYFEMAFNKLIYKKYHVFCRVVSIGHSFREHLNIFGIALKRVQLNFGAKTLFKFLWHGFCLKILNNTLIHNILF